MKAYQKTTTKADRWRGSSGVGPQQQVAIQQIVNTMLDAYGQGPWIKPPDVLMSELEESLKEVDPYQVWNLLDQRVWEMVGGYTGDLSLERQRAVSESKRMYKYNPLAQWTIWIWTSWGMGDKVRVSVPDNEEANADLQEFMTADRNDPVLADDRIKEQSRWLLVKGNRFFVFFTSTADGQTTIRTIDQDEMTPICNPADSKEPWFYKREWTEKGKTQQVKYYPDWKVYFAERDPAHKSLDECWALLEERNLVPKDAKKSWGDSGNSINESNGNPRTDAYIMFVPHNIKDEDELWGWPILTNPRAWLQAHQHLMESRLTLAEAASMYVRRKQVQGGSRAVKSVVNTLASNLSQSNWYDTNPPAVAGATEVDNAQITTTDLPLRTGAGDTASDNRTFSWMALLGGGLFPTSAGLDTSRWATALEMDKAQSMLFEEYKSFWAAQLRKISKIVLLAYEKWNKSKQYGAFTVVVSVDTFSLADFPAIAKTIGGFVNDTITPLLELGSIDSKAAIAIMARFYKMALDSLGVQDAADLTSDEALGIGEPAEPKPAEAQAKAVEQVLENLREGRITPEAAAWFVIGELAEMVV